VPDRREEEENNTVQVRQLLRERDVARVVVQLVVINEKKKCRKYTFHTHRKQKNKRAIYRYTDKPIITVINKVIKKNNKLL
jgi:hypothetical protein